MSIAPVFPVVRMAYRAFFLSLLAAIVATFAACSNYDELVARDQACLQKWADLEATLQRRHDLIPNLVETVKGAANVEKSTLENVAKARAEAVQLKLTPEMLGDPEAMKRFAEAEEKLRGSLGRLMAVAENYPQLKSNENFRNLQVQLEGTENRILRAREEYNKAVGAYNTELGRVRGKVVNKITGQTFKPREYFRAEAGAMTAPKVSF